jgi:DNA-directed RNA polymerase sigma subunit (sigma70/sigma32)
MHNGPGPWPCFECDGPVTYEELLVHHLDHDHDNNDPTNLAASHKPCHITHHKTGQPSPLRGRSKTEEHRHTLAYVKGLLIDRERDALVTRAYLGGLTMHDVGKQFGVSETVVRKILRRTETPSRARGTRSAVAQR